MRNFAVASLAYVMLVSACASDDQGSSTPSLVAAEEPSQTTVAPPVRPTSTAPPSSTPQVTTTSSPPLLPAPSEVDHSWCRLPEKGHKNKQHSTGFPLETENLKPDQHIRVAVIAIDWPDFEGDPDVLSDENENVKTFVDYYVTASQGQLSFDVEYATQWYRLPEPVSSYPQRQVSDFNPKLAQHAINAADSAFDFSAIDLTIFVLPSYAPIPSGVPQTDDQMGSFQHFNAYSAPSDPRMIYSDEGWVRNYIGAGAYFDDERRPEWSYYIHEAAHTLHVPDWYRREANFVLGPNQDIQLEYAIGPMNVWSVMSSQDGPSRTFDSWARWLLGWLNDDQVACFDLLQVIGHGEFDVELVPLDADETGIKSVIIRTGPHSGVVIESRRAIFPDHDLVLWEQVGREPYGLIVYEVDTTINDAEDTLRLVPPEGQGPAYLPLGPRFDPRVIDALYNLGASGFTNNLRIELLRTGDRDVVRISPALSS